MIEVAVYHDLQLKIALNDWLQEDLARLPAESELAASHVFSKRFERKMQRLIRKARKIQESGQADLEGEQPTARVYHLPSRRKRLLLTAIILALLLSLMSVTAAREMVIGFVVEIYEKFSTIIFDSAPGTTRSDKLPSTADEIRNMLPTVLPAGYQQKELQLSDDHAFVMYANQNGDIISLELTGASVLNMKIDTEGIQAEEIMLRQTRALYYSNKGFQNLVWQEGSYIYSISGIITKNELIELAESINR